MAEQLANNAQSTLSAAILSGSTSLTLATGGGASFPSAGPFRVIVDSELILVGARSDDTLSSLTRGTEGTSAAGHSLGATVTCVLTAASLDAAIRDRISTVLTRYAKTTSQAVNTTVTATDLLNSEITIAASTLTTGKRLSGLAWGDFLNSVGSAQSGPRFQLILASSTVADFGPVNARFASSSNRHAWAVRFEAIAVSSSSQLWVVQYQDVAGSSDAWSSSTTTGSVAASSGTGGLVETDQGGSANLSSAVVVDSSAIDMTSSQSLLLKVINGANNASYETRLLGAVIDIT